MAAQTRSRKSTTHNAVRTMQQAAAALPPPSEPLDEIEQAFFDRIIRSRELDTWSEHDLALATHLAQTQRQFSEAMQVVKTEGRTTLNPRGTPVAHPEVAALNQLAGSVRSFTAQLGLSASQRGVAGQHQQSRNAAEREARAVLGRVGVESLLA